MFLGGSLDIPFSIGRKDCTEPETDILPLGSNLGIVDMLSQEFRLTYEEVTALMGQLNG